jgi:hypothetical protein
LAVAADDFVAVGSDSTSAPLIDRQDWSDFRRCHW